MADGKLFQSATIKPIGETVSRKKKNKGARRDKIIEFLFNVDASL